MSLFPKKKKWSIPLRLNELRDAEGILESSHENGIYITQMLRKHAK